MVEAGKIRRRYVAGENLVAHRLEPVDDRAARDEAYFPLGAGAAVEDCYSHRITFVKRKDVKRKRSRSRSFVTLYVFTFLRFTTKSALHSPTEFHPSRTPFHE